MTNSQFSNKVRVRTCAIIVQNSSILLAKMNSPTRPNPIWMPPGGGVELGESLEEAIYRETSEETGLIIKKKQLLWIHEFIEDPYHAIEFYFRCVVTGGNLKMGIDPEIESNQQLISDLAFVPFDKAEEIQIEPLFIKDFCTGGGTFFENVRHVKNSTYDVGT